MRKMRQGILKEKVNQYKMNVRPQNALAARTM
jgi:hypothetical protein